MLRDARAHKLDLIVVKDFDRFARNKDAAAAIQKLVSSLKDFDRAWKAMQLDEKKLILRSIIKEIRGGNGKVEIDFIL